MNLEPRHFDEEALEGLSYKFFEHEAVHDLYFIGVKGGTVAEVSSRWQ